MMIKAHLNSSKKNIFGYNASGQRVDMIRRNSGGTILDSSRIFILGIDSKVIAEYIYVSGAWKVDHYNLYANDMVGKFVPTTGNNGNRYYYEKDHLGSVRVVVNESKNIESWTDFYPYGKESRSSSSINEPTENFTGHQLDVESSMLYAGARYYNSDIGRWIGTDPAGQYQSPYIYVGNNPIDMIDPTGLYGTDFFGDMGPSDAYVEETFKWIQDKKKKNGDEKAKKDGDGNQAGGSNEPSKNDKPTTDEPNYIEQGFEPGINSISDEDVIDIASIFNEPLDWANTFKTWKNEGFSAWDLLGLLPLVPHALARGMREFGGGIRQINDIAKEFKMSREQRRGFGDFVETTKKSEGRGGKDNYTYKELKELAKNFLNIGDK